MIIPRSTDKLTITYNGLDTRVSKIDSLGTQTFHRDGAYVTDPALRDGLANFTPGVSERRAGVTTYSHSNLKPMWSASIFKPSQDKMKEELYSLE